MVRALFLYFDFFCSTGFLESSKIKKINGKKYYTLYYFKLFSAGSTVSVVTKKILGDLKVKVLPIEQQKVLVELSKLKKKEQVLEARKTELYNKLYNHRVLSLIK